MRRTLLIGAAVITIGCSSGLAKNSYIVCTINSTHDIATGKTSGTSGSEVFAVRPQPDGSTSTTYTMPFSCDDGTVKASESDTELSFECDKRIGKFVFHHMATIDRVSGEYLRAFSLTGQDGVVHAGTCARQERRF